MIKFDPSISARDIAAMCLVAIGFTAWLVNGNSNLTVLSGQLTELKTTVDKRFDTVGNQISSIPTWGVQLTQLDRRVTGVEANNTLQDTRIGQAEQAITGLQHDMINIKGASGTLITPGHR